MALRETLQTLLDVQKSDSQIARLQKTRAGLDTGAAAAADLQAAQTAHETAVQTLHHASGELKDSELKQSAVETKQKSYQQKLYQGAVTNAKELANIEKEIAALGRQRGDLDGRILEAMEQAESAQREAERAETTRREAEARHKSVVEAFQSKTISLQEELAALAQQRAETVTLVDDAALLKRYEDIRAKAGGIGIVKIDGGACGGCHMTLPGGIIKAVKEAQSPQTCENCRRLLAD